MSQRERKREREQIKDEVEDNVQVVQDKQDPRRKIVNDPIVMEMSSLRRLKLTLPRAVGRSSLFLPIQSVHIRD